MNTLYQSLFVGVNEAADPQNLSTLEKKHLPLIEAPDVVQCGKRFDVEVEIGREKKHPNEHKHFIQYIELFADETFLSRIELSPVSASPKVTFNIALHYPVDELRAFQMCNMHGTWMSRRKIQVEIPEDHHEENHDG